MPLLAPNLDNRTYADIVREAKSLIPRYAPAWTNLNESDPGITLLELFAWMTEMTIFRLNQVPDLNYIKFLQLLGIELNPAQPAQAEITFTLSTPGVASVIVPKGTQIAASGGDAPVTFETDESLVAIGATLAAIQVFDGFSYSVVTSANSATGQTYAPFGASAREGSALMLGFDSPVTFTDQGINLMIYVASGPAPLGRHCDIALDTLPFPATLTWQYWQGGFWQPLIVLKDETRAFSQSGHIYMQGPGASVVKDKLGNVKSNLYWIRVLLAKNGYDSVPMLESVLTNTVHAQAAQTISSEILGGTNGRPGQTFQMRNTPVTVRNKPLKVKNPDGSSVTVRSAWIQIDEGFGFQTWQQVDDFLASGPNDPHYTLDVTSGSIVLGDGDHGRIPVANAANPTANAIAYEYQFGGGANTNVGAGTITAIQTSAPGVDKATNLRPAFGGSDEETVSEAKLRAPGELKSKGRAVTAEDFQLLAEDTPGVLIRRAKALPLTHPKYPNSSVPGVVTVIVVPQSDAPNPTPGSSTLAVVCAWLNAHRLLTSELYVVPPKYHIVRIEANIIVSPSDDLGVVKTAIETNLTVYFGPLTGGDDGSGWPFGGAIYYSQVMRVILGTPGVSRIASNELVIWLDNERQPFCRDVPIEPGALVYSNGHDIRVSYN